MHRIHKALFQRTLENRGDNFGDLSLVQMDALRCIKMHESIEMGELAKEMAITPASATALADRLVKSGCLERIQDKSDRRLVCLTLSPEAKKKFNRLMELKSAHLNAALAKLSPEEHANLITLLTKLETNLHQ